MHYKKCTRMSMWTGEELMCSQTSPSDGGTSPNPSIEGERPTYDTDIPEHSNAQGTNNGMWGV